MSKLAADRVYAEGEAPTEVFVAADVGVIAVSVAGDRVGRFGVACRCSPRDVAGRDGVLAVATEADVLRRRDDAFERTEFGPAVAVGIGTAGLLAADRSGRLARYHNESWRTVGTVPATVAAIDGPLVATDDGVYRVVDGATESRLQSIGHRAVHDVAARGEFAATDTGLYAIAEDWRWELEGQFHAVAATGPDRVLAAGSSLLRRWNGAWEPVDLPDTDHVADVAVDDRGFAVTEAGSLLVGPEFRGRAVGAREVVGLAVP